MGIERNVHREVWLGAGRCAEEQGRNPRAGFEGWGWARVQGASREDWKELDGLAAGSSTTMVGSCKGAAPGSSEQGRRGPSAGRRAERATQRAALAEELARARELGTARHAGEGIRRRELGAQSTMAVRGERARSLGGLGNNQGARDSVEKQDRCRGQGSSTAGWNRD